MIGRARAVAVLLVALTVGGCGGDPTPGAVSGQYAGRQGDLGAVVDFRASDPIERRIAEIVADRRLRVVEAFIVNRSSRPVLVPVIVAERFDGRLLVMQRADADPLVARVGIVLPRSIPPDGAVTVYLLTRERAEAVTAVIMRRADGTEVTLDPQGE